MTRYALVKSTQVAVVLSLDVVARDRTGVRTYSLAWANLTPVLLWVMGLFSLWVAWVNVVKDSIELVNAFTLVLIPFWWVAVIIGKSLAWGVFGLRL